MSSKGLTEIIVDFSQVDSAGNVWGRGRDVKPGEIVTARGSDNSRCWATVRKVKKNTTEVFINLDLAPFCTS